MSVYANHFKFGGLVLGWLSRKVHLGYEEENYFVAAVDLFFSTQRLQ
jgi:hypothetical protein